MLLYFIYYLLYSCVFMIRKKHCSAKVTYNLIIQTESVYCQWLFTKRNTYIFVYCGYVQYLIRHMVYKFSKFCKFSVCINQIFWVFFRNGYGGPDMGKLLKIILLISYHLKSLILKKTKNKWNKIHFVKCIYYLYSVLALLNTCMSWSVSFTNKKLTVTIELKYCWKWH